MSIVCSVDENGVPLRGACPLSFFAGFLYRLSNRRGFLDLEEDHSRSSKRSSPCFDFYSSFSAAYAIAAPNDAEINSSLARSKIVAQMNDITVSTRPKISTMVRISSSPEMRRLLCWRLCAQDKNMVRRRAGTTTNIINRTTAVNNASLTVPWVKPKPVMRFLKEKGAPVRPSFAITITHSVEAANRARPGSSRSDC